MHTLKLFGMTSWPAWFGNHWLRAIEKRCKGKRTRDASDMGLGHLCDFHPSKQVSLISLHVVIPTTQGSPRSLEEQS